MNTLLLLAVALVAFLLYGGSNVPQAMRKRKEMILGLVVGLALCSFLGVNLEGYSNIMAVDGDVQISDSRVIDQGLLSNNNMAVGGDLKITYGLLDQRV